MKETIKKFRVWITKYALTQGIEEVDVVACDDVEPTGEMVQVVLPPGSYSMYYHGKGREWHETKAGAVAYAGELRRKKIAALKKQILKLEQMTFE